MSFSITGKCRSMMEDRPKSIKQDMICRQIYSELPGQGLIYELNSLASERACRISGILHDFT